MSEIDITRTELVWPGRYDDQGQLVPPRRVNLPFQIAGKIDLAHPHRSAVYHRR